MYYVLCSVKRPEDESSRPLSQSVHASLTRATVAHVPTLTMTSSGAETRDVGSQGAQLVSRASSAQPAHAEWSSSPVLCGAQQAPRRTLRSEPAGMRALSWWACSTGGPRGWHGSSVARVGRRQHFLSQRYRSAGAPSFDSDSNTLPPCHQNLGEPRASSAG